MREKKKEHQNTKELMAIELEVNDVDNRNSTLGIIGQIGGIDTFLLIDTGASHCFISKRFVNR